MKELYSLKDMAKLLGISVKSMKIRVSTGKFKQPDERRNGELFWRMSDQPDAAPEQPGDAGH